MLAQAEEGVVLGSRGTSASQPEVPHLLCLYAKSRRSRPTQPERFGLKPRCAGADGNARRNGQEATQLRRDGTPGRFARPCRHAPLRGRAQNEGIRTDARMTARMARRAPPAHPGPHSAEGPPGRRLVQRGAGSMAGDLPRAGSPLNRPRRRSPGSLDRPPRGRRARPADRRGRSQRGRRSAGPSHDSAGPRGASAPRRRRPRRAARCDRRAAEGEHRHADAIELALVAVGALGGVAVDHLLVSSRRSLSGTSAMPSRAMRASTSGSVLSGVEQEAVGEARAEGDEAAGGAEEARMGMRRSPLAGRGGSRAATGGARARRGRARRRAARRR